MCVCVTGQVGVPNPTDSSSGYPKPHRLDKWVSQTPQTGQVGVPNPTDWTSRCPKPHRLDKWLSQTPPDWTSGCPKPEKLVKLAGMNVMNPDD